MKQTNGTDRLTYLAEQFDIFDCSDNEMGNKIKEIKDIRTDNNASIDNRAPILRNQVKYRAILYKLKLGIIFANRALKLDSKSLY